MSITIEAVYQAGMLKPLRPMNELAENERVRVTIETPEKASAPVPRIIGPPADFTLEHAWLKAHAHEYSGQWVVLDGDRLLGHSSDYQEALRITREAEANGLAVPFATFLRETAEPFWGGWL
jgi:predicted DNA-binding antitoxin AbrB/MazE fold protein